MARQDSTDRLHVTTDCGGIVHSAVEGHEYPFPCRMFITACRPEWASNGPDEPVDCPDCLGAE